MRHDPLSRPASRSLAGTALLLLLTAGAPAADAQVLSATQAATLSADADNDSEADRGDTLRYNVEVSNTGAADATGVIFSETLDPNMTLVPGSLRISPLALDDDYQTLGNTQITVNASNGLLANDFDIDDATPNPPRNDGLQVTTLAPPTALGGSASVGADGSFSYTPPAGVTNATDAFVYSIQDADGLVDTATAVIAIGSAIWYVDNTAGGGGAGTSSSPFNTLAAAEAASAAGDVIFVFRGDGTTNGLNAGIALKNGQTLIGQGTDLTVNGQVLVAKSQSPLIGNAGGDVAALADGNTITGVTLQATAGAGVAGSGISGATIFDATITTSSAGAGVALANPAGAVRFATAAVNGTGTGAAFSVAGGSAQIAYDGTITNAAGRMISIADTAGGSVVFSSPSPAAFSDAGTGILIDGAAGGVSIESALLQGTDGVDLIGDAANPLTGTVTLTNTSINNVSGAAFSANGTAGGTNVTGAIVCNNVDIANTAGGFIELRGLGNGATAAFDANCDLSSTGAGGGIVVESCSGINAVTFSGLVTLGTPASRLSGGPGASIANNAASMTLTLADISVYTSGQAGLAASSPHTLNVAAGQVDALGASALDLSDGTTAGLVLASVNADSGINNAVDIADYTGPVTISNANLTTTSGTGLAVGNLTSLSVNAGGAGTATVTSSAGRALSLAGTSANAVFGSVNSTNSPSNAVNLSNVSGTLQINGGTLAGGAAAPLLAVTGGSATFSCFAALTQANNQPAVSVSGGHAGTMTFGIGTIDIDNGSGLQFDNADGLYTFNGLVDMDNGDAGVDIVNGSGGDFVFSDVSIANPSGTAFNVNGGAGVITVDGTIANAAGRTVEIQNRTGGSVTFQNGSIAATGGTGILINGNSGGLVDFDSPVVLNTGANGALTLSSNAGATIAFGGGLDIDTTSAAGAAATGGGTLTVTGTGNTIDCGSGTGLTVSGVTIGAGGINLRRVSVNGAVNGIVLADTGSAGGLTLTGDGGGTQNASGGLMQNLTGNAVSLTNTRDTVFNQVRLLNAGGHGIIGNGVVNLTLNHCQVQSAGNAGDEDALSFRAGGAAITGTLTLNNTDSSQFHDTGLHISNGSGSLTVNISNGSDFDDNDDTNGVHGVFVETSGTASVAMTVDDSLFNHIESDAIRFDAGSSGTNDINIVDCRSTNGGGPDDFPNGGGIGLHVVGGARLTFDVQGNDIRDLRGDPLILQGAGNMEGTVGGPLAGDKNTFSGSSLGDGIAIDKDDAGGNYTWTVLVENNDIGVDNLGGGFNGLGDDGVQVLHRDGSGTLNLTLLNNNIANAQSEAIRFFSDEDLSGGANRPQNQVRVQGNTFTNVAQGVGQDALVIRMRDSADGCFHIVSNTLSGSPSNDLILDQGDTSTLQITQASTAALNGANTGITTFSGGIITFNGACASPPLPSNP